MVHVERKGIVLRPADDAHTKFNAGMVRQEDTVHMLYRWGCTKKNEQGKSAGYYMDYISYARLDLRGNCVKDEERPVIHPSSSLDSAGCQDPRIVEFEGAYYVFFCCWNMEVARVGIARTTDFAHFERLGIIPTVEWDKDAFIFPERIGGKIAYIHRIEPDIQIDYFDNITDMLEESQWKNYSARKKDRVLLEGVHPWENIKIGGGVPPIKTDIGWLFIYHGVGNDITPFCYRAGVALLDLEDPSIVLARLPYPLFEPMEKYEVTGDVDHVVFPCGCYEDEGWLYISYGAADKYVALVRVKIEELLEELKHQMNGGEGTK